MPLSYNSEKLYYVVRDDQKGFHDENWNSMRSCDGIEKSIRVALGFGDLEILRNREIGSNRSDVGGSVIL